MCSITAAFMVAGGLVQIAAQRQQAQDIAQAAAYQAAVARNNAALAERSALEAEEQGEADVAQQALKTRQFVARQRTALASTGQDVNIGTAVLLQEDVQTAGKLEELELRRSAEREALGFRAQGMNFSAQAQLLRMQRRAALRAGRLAMFGTLLTTATKVSKRFA